MSRYAAALGLAATLSAVLLTGPVFAATAQGTVFEDVNGNARQDGPEPGIAGVMVSNGRAIVRTDETGRYEITVEDGDVLFVIKPTGYMTPVDEAMLPRFHYIHQPDGTPAEIVLRYPGIAPTGPLPDAIDFPLTRQDESGPFEVLLFADTQPQSDAEIDFIRDDVVAELIGTEAAFAVTVGDIMFDDLALFPRYNRLMGRMGVPVYNVPGNHELNFLSPDDRYSLETYKRLIGPPTYAWQWGGVTFIAIDNVDYKGAGAGRDEPTYRGAGMYEGRIPESALGFVEALLAELDDPEAPVVILHHIPLRTYQDPEAANINTVNKEDLFRILSGRSNLYAVHGHTHTTEHHYFGAEDGFDAPEPLHSHIIATVSGSWWSGPNDARGIPIALSRDGTPNGYHIARFDGADLTVRYKAAGLPASAQMRIVFDSQFHTHRGETFRDVRHGGLLAGRITSDQVASTDLVVNVFDGGPNTRVSFSVNGGPPNAMTRVDELDLAANELFVRFADVRKPWVEAVTASHIWRADLPPGTPPGTHTVTVTATDEFGQAHTGHAILEVLGTR